MKLNAGTVLAIVAVAGYVGLEAWAINKVSYRIEPQFVLDEYAAARTATERCATPDAETVSDFEGVFGAVRRRATRDLLKAEPNLGDETVEARLAATVNAAAARVGALIDTSGCDDPEVRAHVRRYELRARLSIR